MNVRADLSIDESREISRQKSDAYLILSAFQNIADHDPRTAFATVDFIRERHAPQHPEIATISDAMLADDAEWWADFTSEGHVVAMLAACLKRLGKRPMIGVNAKKRALVAIWNTLNDTDRAAFLEMVDPGAKGKA